MLSIDSWLDEKPYKEVYDGAIHEKVSPQFRHFVVAGSVMALLQDWARRRGFVPDVAFMSRERLGSIPEEQRAKPPIAPEIVVEVRSPDDRERDIRRKTELYLAHGAILVVNVDPENLREDETIAHAAFPDLRIPVAEVFAPLDDL